MSLEETFARARAADDIALVAYWPVGFPSIPASKRAVAALEKGGADIIELGIPFTDPIADGPVIQSATQQALAKGANPEACLRAIGEMALGRPALILTYYNIMHRMGVEKFATMAKKNGVEALLAADLPIEESGPFERACTRAGIKTCFIIAPNTPSERIREIAGHTTGFLYLMAHYGVTGAKESLESITAEAVRRAKAAAPDTPLCVGFGISKREHVVRLRDAGADGAVVGSAFIQLALAEKSEKKWLREIWALARKLKGI
ncbi:MAG: tryptophan synthase subunit alpha [Candidatus Micrarchaeia archaeon]